MERLTRQQFITRLGVTAVATTLAGCVEDDDGGDDTNGDVDGDDTSESEVEYTTLIDEVIYTDTTVPAEIEAGTTLRISINLERGTHCIVSVANQTEGESVFSDTVSTEDEFEISIEDHGEYIIQFQAHDEAEVKAVVEG